MVDTNVEPNSAVVMVPKAEWDKLRLALEKIASWRVTDPANLDLDIDVIREMARTALEVIRPNRPGAAGTRSG